MKGTSRTSAPRGPAARRSTPRLLALLALALVATPAAARLPAELDGYRSLRFGMTPAQAQQAIGAARCWEDHRAPEAITRCQRGSDAKVAGLPAAYDLHFLGGRLFRIVVELRLPEGSSWTAVSDRYDEVHAQLVARHGKPDEERGEVMIDLGAPHRAARWRGPRALTELWVTASGVAGPAVLQVAYVDTVTMARLGAAWTP